MLTDAQISRLYALCPIWLWPVLAFCVPNVREQLRLLKELGCTGWEVSLTGWGRPYISRVYWPDEAPRWDDALYRAAMGEPVETPKYTPKPTGLATAEDQVDWLLGLGWIALGLAEAPCIRGANAAAAHACGLTPNAPETTARAPPGNTFTPNPVHSTDAAPAPAAEGAGLPETGADADPPARPYRPRAAMSSARSARSFAAVTVPAWRAASARF